MSPFRCRATISPRLPPESPRVSAISGRFSVTAAMPRPNSCRPALNRSAARQIRGGRRNVVARARSSSALRIASPDIMIGDVALFSGLVAGLDLPPAWKRRLIKDFNRKTNLAQDLDRLVLGGNNARPEYQGVLAALAGSDSCQCLKISCIIFSTRIIMGKSLDFIEVKFSFVVVPRARLPMRHPCRCITKLKQICYCFCNAIITPNIYTINLMFSIPALEWCRRNQKKRKWKTSSAAFEILGKRHTPHVEFVWSFDENRVQKSGR